jgi:Ca2+:H+ antiporter
MEAPAQPRTPVWRSEIVLLFGFATAAVFWTVGQGWLKAIDNPLAAAVYFVWLFAVMLWLSFGVVRHAECLAVRLGEPLGTLILTLAVILIEVVMISAVMVTGKENPTMARDTMFSVIMIVLNGMLGITLLVGGLRHSEQDYSLPGARSYLVVLIALGFLCLVLPRYTVSAPGGEPSKLMSNFLIAASVLLYGIFLYLQSTHHKHHFRAEEEGHGHEGLEVRSTAYHAVFLVLIMLPIVLLSKKIALVIDYGIVAVGAPYALAGFLVAVLVLSPEGLAAVNAALSNQLQRTVNIAFGSALATIGLTVPAVLAISEVTGKRIELGLNPDDIALLALTFFVAAINFGGTRTTILGGAVHIVIFLAYLVLIFD